jgi:zinc protease
MPTSFDRSVAPSGGVIRPFRLPAVESAKLGNGLQVLSMHRGEVPLVSVCLVLAAGEAGVPMEQGGLAVLTGDTLQGGTEQRSGVELAEALERLGTGLRVSTTWDATTLAFTCVAERLDGVMALLAEVACSPAFSTPEVDRLRRERLSSIRQRAMNPRDLADDELDRRVFASTHPYHRPLAGDERSVSRLNRDHLVAFAGGYSPSGGGLLLVGDLSSDQAVQLAERHFGDWHSEGLPRAGIASPRTVLNRSIVLVHRPGAVQSELRIGHRGVARGDADEIPLRVSNIILGGAFTSRLNLSLREEHGFTYGARSANLFRRDGGAFTIGTAIQTEVTAAALGEAIKVFDTFVDEGPTEEELARARDYLAGVLPLRMETTSQLAGGLAELIVFDLSADYHHTYRDRIRAVTVAGARDVIRRHLYPDQSVVVVVGDAERTKDAIEALDLGSVEVAEPWA